MKGIRGWFERRTGKDMWIGISVVLAAAILSEVTTLFRTGAAASSTGASTVQRYDNYFRESLYRLGTWVLSSLIIHGSSRLLKGKGSLRRFFAMNGFAYVPILIQSILSVLDVMFSGVLRSPLASQPTSSIVAYPI